jgi:uncharacterized protein involved in type VI secretion and phage assembly
MNRLHPSTTKRRLTPRATVVSGAALGLLAGAAVYGGVSSSASAAAPAYKPANASAKVAPVSYAKCAPATTFEKGTCVVHVVRTVVLPSPATAAQKAKQARSAGVRPGHTLERSGDSQDRHEKAEFGSRDRSHESEESEHESGDDREESEGSPSHATAPVPAPAPAPAPAPTPAPTATPTPTATVPAPAPSTAS